MSAPILNPGYNEGYPSPVLINTPAIKFTVKTKYIDIRIGDTDFNEGYPNNNNYLVDVADMKAQKQPFPRILPSVIAGYNEDYPVINEIDATNVKVQTRPFPRILPEMDNEDKLEGYPSFEAVDYITDFGAFCNVPTLIKIKIPSTVKFIQDYSFWNTGLKKVTIAPDCKYFEHSFPEECQIEFYEE